MKLFIRRLFIARELVLKVRIFALAKELGLDNKELVQLALDAGLDVKSSPLASVTEEQAALLRERAKSKPAAPVEVSREEATPVREATGDRKLKDLGRTGGAGPLASRRRRQTGEAQEAEPIVAKDSEVDAEEVVEPAATAEQPVVEDAPVASDAEAPSEPEEKPATDAADEKGVEPAAEAEPDVPSEGKRRCRSCRRFGCSEADFQGRLRCSWQEPVDRRP